MPAEAHSRHCRCDVAITFDRCSSRPAAADADYFLQTVAPHLVTIRGLIRHILQHEAEVENALQETLLLAFCNRCQLRDSRIASSLVDTDWYQSSAQGSTT
jgi:hypothetical protein